MRPAEATASIVSSTATAALDEKDDDEDDDEHQQAGYFFLPFFLSVIFGCFVFSFCCRNDGIRSFIESTVIVVLSEIGLDLLINDMAGRNVGQGTFYAIACCDVNLSVAFGKQQRCFLCCRCPMHGPALPHILQYLFPPAIQ